MQYSIVLERLDDQNRYIEFDNTTPTNVLLKNIYDKVWDIIFKETSDAKFGHKIFLRFFKSMNVMIKFHHYMLNKNIVNSYKNFKIPFFYIKRTLTFFNYWTKQERINIYILKYNTNYLLAPEQIVLNKSTQLIDHE